MKIYLKDIKRRYPKLKILNYNPDIFFEDFNHDSRVIVKDSLFIPIVGDNFDGHNYVLEAFEKGSTVSLFQSDRHISKELNSKPLIVVDDVMEWLGKTLSLLREQIKVPVVAITGSTGKTTTREMLSVILSSKGEVLKSDRNFNTLWGNAQILAKYKNHKYIVLEFGMDRKGEILSQCNAIQPDIGIVLNVGYVHAMQLGGIENILLEKRSLADYLLSKSKPVLINLDDERVAQINSQDGDIITLGSKKGVDYLFKEVNIDKHGTYFKFSHGRFEYEVVLKIFGKGYVYNAMAAIAVSNRMGIDIYDAIAALEKYDGFKGRFEIIDINQHVTIVNDAYNANPQSMKMSLETFNTIWNKGDIQRILVLGDMKELGDVSDIKHKELGEIVKNMNVDKVYYIGEYFNQFGVGENLDNLEILYDNLQRDISKSEKTVILFKGSNSIGLEQVVEKFTLPT